MMMNSKDTEGWGDLTAVQWSVELSTQKACRDIMYNERKKNKKH